MAQLEVAAKSSEILPLAYLLQIMRDERELPDRRMFAAKAAAPYRHPALNAIEVSGPEKGPAQARVVLTFD